MSRKKLIAERAEELIVKHGWKQGSLGNKEEGFCLVGALSAAYCELNHQVPHLHLGTRSVWRRLPFDIQRSVLDNASPYLAPWEWNDSINRTKEDVRNLLKKIAGE